MPYARTTSDVLLSFRTMLKEPNPNNPLDPHIASLYKTNKILHDKRANDITVQHAEALAQQYQTADTPTIIKSNCKYMTKNLTVILLETLNL